MLSTLIAPDIVEYLDTGKIGARSVAGERIIFARPGPELEYWEDEDYLPGSCDERLGRPLLGAGCAAAGRGGRDLLWSTGAAAVLPAAAVLSAMAPPLSSRALISCEVERSFRLARVPARVRVAALRRSR